MSYAEVTVTWSPLCPRNPGNRTRSYSARHCHAIGTPFFLHYLRTLMACDVHTQRGGPWFSQGHCTTGELNTPHHVPLTVSAFASKGFFFFQFVLSGVRGPGPPARVRGGESESKSLYHETKMECGLGVLWLCVCVWGAVSERGLHTNGWLWAGLPHTRPIYTTLRSRGTNSHHRPPQKWKRACKLHLSRDHISAATLFEVEEMVKESASDWPFRLH